MTGFDDPVYTADTSGFLPETEEQWIATFDYLQALTRSRAKWTDHQAKRFATLAPLARYYGDQRFDDATRDALRELNEALCRVDLDEGYDALSKLRVTLEGCDSVGACQKIYVELAGFDTAGAAAAAEARALMAYWDEIYPTWKAHWRRWCLEGGLERSEDLLRIALTNEIHQIAELKAFLRFYDQRMETAKSLWEKASRIMTGFQIGRNTDYNEGGF